MENKRHHLQMIQGLISRMAGNLFFLKGWAITLIAALFALAAKDANSRYIIIAYFPVFVFWILDGYYLRQERLFRDLYDDVRKRKDDDIDFSMDTRKYHTNERNGWLCSMFSATLVWFYVPLIIMMLVIMVLINRQ
jgi:hypothetical protein